MIKKSSLYSFIFTFSVLLSSACFSQQNENSLLWEISGNGLNKPSYIFGTMHIISAKNFYISDTLKSKLKSSNILITEIDMDISFLKKMELASNMTLSNNKTLKDYLNEDDFNYLKSYLLDTLKIGIGKFKKYIMLKPFFLSSVISSKLMGKTKSYEPELFKLAKKYNIESTGLETIDFQISIIESVSIANQAKSLMKEIKSSKSISADMIKLNSLYKMQNIDELSKLISDESDNIDDFVEKFLTSRNVDWIPKIIRFSIDNSCFFAVGAGHLGGNTGLISLLKQQGYILTPIKIKI